jgi:hypothetical protein
VKKLPYKDSRSVKVLPDVASLGLMHFQARSPHGTVFHVILFWQVEINLQKSHKFSSMLCSDDPTRIVCDFQVQINIICVYVFLQAFIIPGSIFLNILAGSLYGFYKALILVLVRSSSLLITIPCFLACFVKPPIFVPLARTFNSQNQTTKLLISPSIISQCMRQCFLPIYCTLQNQLADCQRDPEYLWNDVSLNYFEVAAVLMEICFALWCFEGMQVLATIGSAVCYMLSYLILKEIVYYYFPERCGRLAQEVHHHRHNLLNYILFLRITPIFPNWFINVSAPIVSVPLQ